MTSPPKRKTPASGNRPEAGARTAVAGEVQGIGYSGPESPAISIEQQRGFVRLSVNPTPVEGIGLPSTYSSRVLAAEAAERLARERGWKWEGGRDG